MTPAENQNLSAGVTGLLQIGLIENAPCRVVSAEYLYDLRRRLFGSSTGPITPERALEVARKSGADVNWAGADPGLAHLKYAREHLAALRSTP